jgi:hypothetical protein
MASCSSARNHRPENAGLSCGKTARGGIRLKIQFLHHRLDPPARFSVHIGIVTVTSHTV